MAKLKVSGSASGTGTITLIAPATSTDRTITLPDESITLGGGVDGIVSTADATAITIDSSENTTFSGTVTADTSITVGDTADPTITLQSNTPNSASSGRLRIAEDGSNYFDMRYDGSANKFIIESNDKTNAFVITREEGKAFFGGFVEIGNFSATGVTKGSEFNTDGKLTVSSNTSGSTNLIGFYNTNINVGNIISSGSSTSYSTSSDYRLKENVVPMVGSIDRLKTLKPSHFNFIADADTTVDGFLAHEAQEVVPEAITGTKDAMKTEEYEVTPAVMDGEDVVTEAVMGEREVEDYQGIDQSKLVPLLVASLQEAIAKIEELTTRIEKLEVI